MAPLRESLTLPGIALNSEVFIESKGQILNWEGAPTNLFWESLEIKSWIQRVQFYLTLKTLNSEWAQSFQSYFKLSFSVEAFSFLKKSELMSFAIEKELQAGDIELFKFANEDLVPLFQSPLVRKFSKSEFIQVSEWLIELSQQGQRTSIDLLHLANNSVSPSTFFERIKTLRTPITTQKDETLKAALSQIKLGNGIQTKWTRRGDVAGIEVRFFVSQSKELPRQIHQLERLQSVFDSKPKESLNDL